MAQSLHESLAKNRKRIEEGRSRVTLSGIQFEARNTSSCLCWWNDIGSTTGRLLCLHQCTHAPTSLPIRTACWVLRIPTAPPSTHHFLNFVVVHRPRPITLRTVTLEDSRSLSCLQLSPCRLSAAFGRLELILETKVNPRLADKLRSEAFSTVLNPSQVNVRRVSSSRVVGVHR